MTIELTGRAQAIKLGLKHYSTGKLCKHGHIAPRFTSTSTCTVCDSEMSARYRQRNPERRKLTLAVYTKTPKFKAAQKRCYQKNKDSRLRYQAGWRAANKERHAQLIAAWQARNPDRTRANQARRYVCEVQRTPLWADLAAIARIYKSAVELSRETGIAMHVDHEIPLRGKRVSGLHVEANLRVISATENYQKNNKFDVAA